MSVLERFSSPLRSRDAAARARAVQKHPPEDTRALAELARSDPDARVRKEAVRRLEAPRVLLELVESAGDEAARRLARSRSEALLVKIASDDRDLEESRRALGLLAPPRGLAEVAVRARFGPVREEALARLVALAPEDGERDAALALVAGKAAEPVARGRALEAIQTPDGLLQVAVSAEDRESAQAAVRRLEDPERLLTAANTAGSKNVRRLARRRAEERLPPDHPERVRTRDRELLGLLERLGGSEAAMAAMGGEGRRLLEEAERVAASGPVSPALASRLEELRAGLAAAEDAGADPRRLLVPTPEPPAGSGVEPGPPEREELPPADLPPRVEEILAALEDPEKAWSFAELEAVEREGRKLLDGLLGRDEVRERLRAAVAAARPRALERKKSRLREFQLAEIADHAEGLAKSLGDRPTGREVAQARRELKRLEKRFAALEAAEGSDADRFRAAVKRVEAALEGAETARRQQHRESKTRVEALGKRLETLESADPLPLDEAEAALRELAQLKNKPTLWRQAPPAAQARFERIQAALMPRLREAREMREWRHWSNLEEQAGLIRRARALLEDEDLRRVDRELVALERAWHKARHTGRERGQELWEEWGKVREEVLARVAPLREAAEREVAGKLAALLELVEQAEAIAEDSDPRRAAELRDLMPVWKERAKGLGKRSEALWKRFRGASDRYFTELKATRKQRLEELSANIPVREELITRARALSEEGNAEAVRNAVRGLMREWKEAPPVPRREGDRLWEVFREACDGARDRLRQPSESETDGSGRDADPAATAAAAEAEAEIRARIEALGAQPAAARRDGALSLWEEYRRFSRSQSGGGPSRDTEKALLACLGETLAEDPGVFAGTRLDQDDLRSRLDGFLGQLEDLLRPPAAVSSEAGVASIAAHLQRSLGAGRAADAGASLREDARTAIQLVERARAAGPALTEAARETRKRIEGLARKVIARAPDPEEQQPKRRRARPRGPRRPDR